MECLRHIDVRRDVLSMVGGAAQWGLTGRQNDLTLYRDGLTALPTDVTTLKMIGATNRSRELDDKIDALASAAQDEFSTVQAIVSGADVNPAHIAKQVAAGIVDERDKLNRFMTAERDLSAAVERVFPLQYFTGAGSFRSSNSTSASCCGELILNGRPASRWPPRPAAPRPPPRTPAAHPNPARPTR